MSSAFSASIEIIMWFLLFLLLIWCTWLTDLQMLNHPWIPRINLTWLWCMILFIYCWIHFANTLLKISASVVHQRYWPGILISVVSLVLESGWSGLVEWGITSHLSECLSSKSLQIKNVGENVEKKEPLYTGGRNVNWGIHYGKQYGSSSKF